MLYLVAMEIFIHIVKSNRIRAKLTNRCLLG